ncbi:thioredoxin [Paenibacillus sp. MWE-103]|uniref:Thioredoxin n=1 Tax=Paenibacillus artemisiicola TaxID=1172618 RepID=A0ABS3W845_9BACL|nr:thioredoxin domain-containing protein [Paenibacillus artemisiicola]MBO7744448.1 thioredoxin [Paenibacillus artemisiicola]
MKVVSLTSEHFREQIDHGITLVNFCKSGSECEQQLVITEELADEVKHQATIVKIDIEQETELAMEYGVKRVPTFMLFKNGYQVETLMGPQSKDVLRQTIIRHAVLGDTC